MLIYPERFAKKDRTDRQKTPFIKLSDFVAAKICVGSTAETNCDLDPTYPKINPVCAHGKGASINHMTLLRGGGGQLESQRGVIRGGGGQLECHMTIYVTFWRKKTIKICRIFK